MMKKEYNLLKKFVSGLSFLFVLLFVSCALSRNVSPSARTPTSDDSLFYKIEGKGKPRILFLHGILGSHRYWDGVVPKLSEHHELILVDLLGFGESPKPKIEFTVAQHLTKIEGVLQSVTSEKSPLIIVGHSMGAFLALNYAMSHPEQVEKLILINPPMKTDEESLKKAIADSSSHLMVTMTFSKT